MSEVMLMEAAGGLGVGMGLAAIGAGIGLGLLSYSAFTSVARQPEIQPKIQALIYVIAGLIEGVAVLATIFLFLILNK